MFIGTYTTTDPGHVLEIQGYDFYTHYQLKITNPQNILGGGSDEVWVTSAPTRIDAIGAENTTGDTPYNWNLLNEICNDLWVIKQYVQDTNLITDGSEITVNDLASSLQVGVRKFQISKDPLIQFAIHDGLLCELTGAGWDLHEGVAIDLGEPRGMKETLRIRRSTVKAAASPQEGISYRPLEEVMTPELEWLTQQDYRLVTPSTLDETVQTLLDHDGPVCFDTETTGLGLNFKSALGESDELVGLVFSIKEGQSWYFPLKHNIVENCVPDEMIPELMERLRPVFERGIIAFNSSFDTKALLIYDIVPRIHADVQVMYHVSLWHTQRGVPDLDHPGRLSGSLKNLAAAFLGRKSLELEMFLPPELQTKRNAWSVANFADLPAESVRLYACADTDNTLALYRILSDGVLDEYGAQKTFVIENAFANVIAYSEFFGAHVGVDLVPQLKADLDKRAEDLMQQMVEIVGHEFNPGSSKQLATVLYEELGYPILEYTSTGAPSSGKKVLEKLASRSECTLVPILQKYKEILTTRSTFLKAIEHGTEDGYLFPSIKALLETGRMATSNPNIQGTPSFVKRYYTARPGYYTINFDFSSIEYRLLACLAGEQALIEFFEDPIKDYHRKQASVLFDTPYAEVTSKLRKIAKPFNFALPYGKGDPNLGADLFGEVSDENTRKAAELRAKYFAEQPHVEQFFVKAKAEVRSQGWVETYFHRRRYLDPSRLGEGNLKRGLAAAERAAGNHKIQGTAADLYKMGMIRLYNEILKRGWYGKVLVTAMVHDECNMEVHCSVPPWEVLDAVLRTVMIKIPGWCPLYVGAGFGSSWGQAKDQDLSYGTQQLIIEQGPSYDWDGDIDRWVEWTEARREEYMLTRIQDEVLNPNASVPLDPDIADFVSQLVSRRNLPGSTPRQCLVEVLRLLKLDESLAEKFYPLFKEITRRVDEEGYCLYQRPSDNRWVLFTNDPTRWVGLSEQGSTEFADVVVIEDGKPIPQGWGVSLSSVKHLYVDIN